MQSSLKIFSILSQIEYSQVDPEVDKHNTYHSQRFPEQISRRVAKPRQKKAEYLSASVAFHWNHTKITRI